MCGRFTLGSWERGLLAEELGVPVESLPEVRPRYNIAPTDEHILVRMRHEEREVISACWGLVNSWAKDASRASRQINARAERVASTPAFRQAFRRRRCLVPADGFYEWTGPREARQPYWFFRPDGHLLLFAGLYEAWQPRPGAWQRTFAIVTTSANELMAPYHDRMPVILGPDAADRWLDPQEESTAALEGLLTPPGRDLLDVRPVSRSVNSVRVDSADLIRPLASLL